MVGVELVSARGIDYRVVDGASAGTSMASRWASMAKWGSRAVLLW